MSVPPVNFGLAEEIAMSLRNTELNYGSVAKWLHWITALLFLGAYVAVYYRHWFTEAKTPENWTALQLHLSFGISIGVLVILRIVWRLNNPSPKLEPGSRLEQVAAKVGHVMLYAIMVITPLTGYIGTGVNTEYFFLFDIIKFEGTPIFSPLIENGLGMSFKEFEKPIDFVHKELLGSKIVWLLILGHFLAAMYHHFVKKDRTLKKMTTNQ